MILCSIPNRVYSLKVAAFRNSYAHSAEKLAGEEMSAISLENVQPIPDILTISLDRPSLATQLGKLRLFAFF